MARQAKSLARHPAVQARTDIDILNQQAEPYLQSMSDSDYLTYKDRWMAFGEPAALQWVIGKYGQQQ